MSSDFSGDDHEELAGTRTTATSVHKEPSPELVESSLERAIDRAPERDLRDLLKELVRAQPAANAAVTKQLLVPIAGSESRKRKAIESCILCEEDYLVTDNMKGSCTFHPGK